MRSTSFEANISAACLIVVCASGHAQTLPDAGQLQRQAQPAAPEPSGARERIPGQSANEPLSDDPQLLNLRRVSVIGHSVFDAATLVQAFSQGLAQAGGPRGLPGQVRLGQLQAGAARVAQTYHQRGYFLARVVLGPGALSADGELTLRVLEGQLSGLSLERSATQGAPSPRGHELAAVVDTTFQAQGVQTGQVVLQSALEQSLLILAERGLPNINAAFSAGEAVGSTALTVRGSGLQLGPQFAVSSDNHGSRFTGSARAHLDYGQRHLLQLGDSAAVRYSTSRGGRHASGQAGSTHSLGASYSTPVGVRGTLLQLNAANMRYTVGGPFAALSANGHGSSFGVTARHPIWLQVQSDLVAEAGLTRRTSQDDTFAGNTARKAAQVLHLGLSHGQRGADHALRAQASLLYGKLDLSGNPAFALGDAASAATAGRYSKLRLDAAYQQSLAGLQLQTRVSAQVSNQNLDSAEKFSLGGPTGVRAFAGGEASGDAGQLLGLELRWTPLQVAGLSGVPYLFIDHGSVTQHRRPWPAALAVGQPNRVSLGGVGLGAQFAVPSQPGLGGQLTLAWPTTANPVASSSAALPGSPALGSDARPNGPRAWASLRWAL